MENQPEQDLAAKYTEVTNAISNLAMELARENRSEQAGEKEVQALHSKVNRLSTNIESLRGIFADREKPASYSVLDLIRRYDEETRGHSNVSTTGLPKLDRMLGGGLEPATLVVLLGAPGMGKTALANQIADRAASTRRPVVYLTSEDTPHRLLSKTIARRAKINFTAVRKGDPDYLEEIKAALAEYAQTESAYWLRYIDVTARPYTLSSVLSEVKAHFERGEPGQGLLVVDYLQKLASAYCPHNDPRVSIGTFVKVLREQAVEMKCCLLALASQSRAGMKGKDMETLLTSGKETGEIEYYADVVMALVKNENDNSIEEGYRVVKYEPRILFVVKNRLEDTGQVLLSWCGAYQHIAEVGGEEGV